MACRCRHRPGRGARGLARISRLPGNEPGAGPDQEDKLHGLWGPRPQAAFDYHFPDGNATIARILVRELVPGSMQGTTAEDSVTAKVDNSKLDHPESRIRIRLSRTVVQVKDIGNPGTSKGVEVAYGPR
jgi:hypothetical protein